MAKLTKVQVEFFDKFSRNILTNTLLIKLEGEGNLPSQEVQDQIALIIGAADVSLLSQAVSDKLLTMVDFKTLQKVEKFLNSQEARQAMIAAQQVGALVETEIFAVLSDIFAEQAVVATE